MSDTKRTEVEQMFYDQLEGWDDRGPLKRDELVTMWYLCQYISNVLESVGATFRGLSFRVASPLSILVIKAAIGGESVVAFYNERTLLSCARIFLRHAGENAVEWRNDKYA